jgi:hypothetical protein
MEPERYGDLFGEALGHGAERAAQLGAVIGAASQVIVQHKAQQAAEQAGQDESVARFLARQRRTDREAARSAWAPARDPAWLADAGLLDVARAWGAAAPFAEADPGAAAAVRACERRLRGLHPYAMARYDRLRADGAGLDEAMNEVVPLFARHPYARPHPGTARIALDQRTQRTATRGAAPAPRVSDPAAADGLDEPAAAALARGREIVAELNQQADGKGREQLSPGELSTALEILTNLPDDIIATLAAEREAELGAAGLARAEDRRATLAEQARAADLAAATDLAATPQDERAEGLDAAGRDNVAAAGARTQAAHHCGVARLHAREFPATMKEAIEAAASRGGARAAAGPAATPGNTRQPGQLRGRS